MKTLDSNKYLELKARLASGEDRHKVYYDAAKEGFEPYCFNGTYDKCKMHSKLKEAAEVISVIDADAAHKVWEAIHAIEFLLRVDGIKL